MQTAPEPSPVPSAPSAPEPLASEPRPREALRGGLLRSPRVALRLAAEGALEGIAVAREAPLDPPAAGHLRRLAYGAALPIAILRALLRDPVERRRYLIQTSARAAAVIAVTALIGVAGFSATNAILPGEGIEIEMSRGFALISAIYGTLCAVEWVVIALTHDYDDQTARRAALLIGVPPEDPERAPRVRLDVPWIGKRIKRRIRGLRVLFAGVPVIGLVTALPLIGPELYAALFALWSAYWFVVITASKSAAAWREEGRAPAPWFIRAWDYLTQNVVGFRWGLPRAYGRFFRRQTEAMSSPCAAVEGAPAPHAGVALLRIIGSLPCAYIFLRPFFPVATAHIQFTRERAAAPAPEGPTCETSM